MGDLLISEVDFDPAGAGPLQTDMGVMRPAYSPSLGSYPRPDIRLFYSAGNPAEEGRIPYRVAGGSVTALWTGRQAESMLLFTGMDHAGAER